MGQGAPNEEDFIRPPPLEELVDPTKTHPTPTHPPKGGGVKQTFIPRQGELTKLLKQIRTRILHSTHLTSQISNLQNGVNDLRDLKAACISH